MSEENEDYNVGDATERPIFYPSVEDLPLPGANPGAFIVPESGANPYPADGVVETFNLPARCTKHQTVMHLAVSDKEGSVTYEQIDLETGYAGESLELTKDMFNEMGNPLIVTVSVRPGDHLN